jgi:hypothetical protein
MSGQPWDASYHDGPAPWDTGQPQPAVVRLVARGAFAGPVLDGTVLDCGLFHTFDGDERLAYVASLASVTEPGGTLYALCFSDEGPGVGPHPVSRDDLTAAFGAGHDWQVATVEPERVQTRYHDDDGAPAWLATVTRI